MKKNALSFLFILGFFSLKAQLTIDRIMDDPKVSVGALPSAPFWSEDSRTVYFSWNPELNKTESLYGVDAVSGNPYKISLEAKKAMPAQYGDYNRARNKKVFLKNGDIFLLDLATMQTLQLTNTVEYEGNPGFNAEESEIQFTRNNNLFSINLSNAALTQWTNFVSGGPKPEPKETRQEELLKEQQMSLFEVLRQRSDKKDEEEEKNKAERPKRPKEIFLDEKRLEDVQLSPNNRFVTYELSISPKNTRKTIVPGYVTESGFTEDIPARTKVGSAQTYQEFWVYDIQQDTVRQLNLSKLEGITDQPAYLKEYAGAADSTRKMKPETRKVYFQQALWQASGRYAVLVVRSLDNKDRWIVRLDPETMEYKVLDRWRDEAWIGGPVYALGFLAGDSTLYYQSEVDGYAHLYTVNVNTGAKIQLTKGAFEVQSVKLSNDKKYFYLVTNELHPGEQHFYRMSIQGGERIRLTQKSGAYQPVLSPDESRIAYLYSTPTQPWELYVQENRPDAAPRQITRSQSKQFQSYTWREPKLVKIRARDGAEVYARLYESKGKKGQKPAVIFVHGAGYLQNAHRWWSQYFREYMFHNFLADQGYTVLDMDYRGSSGYGRDWRTGIYRYMGGKDLDDQVDGAAWLVEHQGVDAKRIGMYGGSYGGFITLMAMFTRPGVIRAGAALRPVTDWAAYNHPYTSNILNEPQTDSLAYFRSSPINFADGLQGHLLICHGMVDVNVHFQDAVRLSQRLIELRKENWEMAAYPVEDHGFVEPTSWADEYKRIFGLFERTLKGKIR